MLLKPEQGLRRTASLETRLGEAVDFFQTNVTDALNKTKEEVSSEFQEISTSFPERQEAAKQALAFGDEETRSRILWTTLGETTHLARISALSPFSNRRRVACAGTGRNVLSCALVRMQRRRKVRTWTSTSLDDFGFHQDPQQDGVE